jgi:hypothetical protein
LSSTRIFIEFRRFSAGNYGNDNLSPFLIECPFSNVIPHSVSLVPSRCAFAENNLKILNRQPVGGVKKRFGVCSKQVSYTDREPTIRFIEWVHMMRLLGAEKVHFPYQQLHPDMLEVVKHFEDIGMVEAWPYFDPTGVVQIRTQNPFTAVVQKNVMTDCFYRVKNLYEFVAVIDFDEE